MQPAVTFTGDLVVKILNKNLYELYLPINCSWQENGKEVNVIIPAGFITDFASTPKFLWSIYPPTGLYTLPALVHDYLYKNGYATDKFKRKFCDQAFLDLMLASQVIFITRWCFYLGVRAFGWKFFLK